MTSNQPESASAACARLTDALGFTVTRQQYRWWLKRGYDTHDLNSLRRKLLNQERMPAGADPKRLRADMLILPVFGRHLRDVLENMPLDVIDDIRADPDQAIRPLCNWVIAVLNELVRHPGCPEGLPLTEEEAAATAAYIEEARRKKRESEV